MSTFLQTGALLCTVFGLLSAGLVLLARRNGLLALPVLLDFLLAAGLLRLADRPSPRAIATAAGLVGLRKLVTFGLAQGRR